MQNPPRDVEGLKQTPLNAAIRASGGRMVPFAGWEMPVQYAGLLKEHQAVRQECGIFDISHMGVIRLNGPGAKDALQALVPTDLFRIGPGEACYTVLLNEEAGIIDDLIVYDKGWNKAEAASELLLVVNASRTDRDRHWIREKIERVNCRLEEAEVNNVLLALQGPRSKDVLSELSGLEIGNIPFFGHRVITFPGIGEVFVARTGYTGEDGFELLMNAEAGEKLWRLLLNRGVEPCGLGARDMLRLEAGMLLCGNDMDETTSPLESGLGWLVHLEMQKDFIGRSVLEKQTAEGAKSCLVSLIVEGKAIPRSGCEVIATSGEAREKVGLVTSGGWSPILNKGIALARIESSAKEKELEIKIRGKYQQTVRSTRNFLKNLVNK